MWDWVAVQVSLIRHVNSNDAELLNWFYADHTPTLAVLRALKK